MTKSDRKTSVIVRPAKAVGRCLALLVAAFLPACRPDRHTLTIRNKSGQTVTWLTVDVCGQSLAFSNLPTGVSRKTNFAITSDSGYVVTGALASGTPVQGMFGYTTKQLGREKVQVDLLPGGTVKGTQSAASLMGTQ
jgi:hypothetical protein